MGRIYGGPSERQAKPGWAHPFKKLSGAGPSCPGSRFRKMDEAFRTVLMSIAVVARKSQRRRREQQSPQDLEGRVHKALREGRTQQALELAKQLHKHEPSPAHQ